MSELPVVYLARHGETAWSLTGQHTGLTDLPLTPRGEQNARRLGERLRGLKFAKVFTSPLQRAARTCALAGFERYGGRRYGPPRMELRRLRRAADGRHSRRAARLAIVSRRLPWRRNARASRRSGRQSHRPRASNRGGCAAVFERSHPPRPRRAMARAGRIEWEAVFLEYRQSEHVRLRARPIVACCSVME